MDRRARFACIACRRLKRKCPKELPSCSLCHRLEKRCEYPPRVRNLFEYTNRESLASSQNPNREVDFQGSSGFPTELHLNLANVAVERHGHVDSFPTMFFLDSEVCVKPLPPSDSGRPMASEATPYGISSETYTIYDKYFSTAHQWIPILSRKLTRRNLLESKSTVNDPSQLLLMCMKLVSDPLSPEASARADRTYMKVLQSLLEAENAYLPCLQLLQSIILISVYEIGHAIYPAAYLRVGHASRLCIMMGLHDRRNAPQLFKSTFTWTAREEERRAWWAVFCLDRIINQGISGLSLAAPELSPGELLPCSERSWDEGGVGFNEPLFAASFSNNTSLGSFANVCQAAHVLGRVLRHRDELHSTNVSLDFRIAEAKQLRNILVSLSSHLSDVYREGGDEPFEGSGSLSLALCLSALLILYEIYACNEKYSADHGRSSEEATMQREAMKGIFDTVRCTWQLARQLLGSIHQAGGSELESLSPFLCHCLYTAAGECEWLLLEQEDPSAGVWLRDIVKLLEVMCERWRVTGVYLSEIYKWPGYNSLVK